jgi:NADH:ubiquinone oxidoreductase subunit 4 (subunit M)
MYIAISSDLKKVGAYLSVLHMNLGVYVLACSGQLSALSTDVLWSAHSVIAFMYFWWLGQVYSITGTRTLQAHSASSSLTPLAVILVLQVLILNLAIPLGPLYYPELATISVLPHLLSSFHALAVISILILSGIFLMSLLLRTCIYHDTKASFLDLSSAQSSISLLCIVWFVTLATV